MKQLVGSDIGSYAFDPAMRTITMTGLPALTLANLLVITNVTAGAMLYNFADPTLGGSIAENVLTLDVDTTAMSGADELQIWVDLPAIRATEAEDYPLDVDYTTDTNLQQVFGSAPLTNEQGVRCSNLLGERRAFGILNGANSEVRIDCTGMNTVALQLTGGWSGLVGFYCSVNGADFVPYTMASVNAGISSSRTDYHTNGIFAGNCAGIKSVLVRFTTATSGVPIVVLNASAGKGGPNLLSMVQDYYMPSVLGTYQLYSPAHTELDQFPAAPTVYPTQPTSYAEPKFSRYPQRFRRLRVEVAGSERLPCAQEPGTNKLIVSAPDLYAKIEELLLQQIITNQLLAQAFGLSLPSGMPDVR